MGSVLSVSLGAAGTSFKASFSLDGYGADSALAALDLEGVSTIEDLRHRYASVEP